MCVSMYSCIQGSSEENLGQDVHICRLSLSLFRLSHVACAFLLARVSNLRQLGFCYTA
jgi:hypothetical protein